MKLFNHIRKNEDVDENMELDFTVNSYAGWFLQRTGYGNPHEINLACEVCGELNESGWGGHIIPFFIREDGALQLRNGMKKHGLPQNKDGEVMVYDTHGEPLNGPEVK